MAAIRAAQLGAEVTLVEKEHLGGTCLNVGCIPTKCLLHSAEMLSELQTKGEQNGIIADHVRVDFNKVMEHKTAISKQLASGVAGLLKANQVTVVQGQAQFTAPGKVRMTTTDGQQQDLEADKIILATGSSNVLPPISGLKESPHCIDSTGALALESLPKSMVVVGGGVIGLELACAYAAFGTEITVVEAMDHVLPMLDSEITAIGLRHMKRMGMKFYLEAPVQAVESSEVGAKVICRKKDGENICFEAEKVLVAVGRKPNTAALNLAAGGIKEERGSILVNSRMETNVPGVYAIGDCVKGYAQLAHTASAMGETAAENAMGGSSEYDESTSPTCVYIEPEAAAVGLTEEQCKERKLPYKVGKFPMAGNGKALILNGGEGTVKIIASLEDDKLLGMHIIGPRASDLIAEGALAIRMHATVEDLVETIHSHPTVTEALREAALDAEGRVIHMPPARR